MASRKKKRPRELKPLTNNIRSPQNENEYDVSANFRKVSPYTKRHNQFASSTEAPNGEYTRGRTVRSVDGIASQTTGVLTLERYDRLEDKISDFNEKNEAAHSSLRKELEQKIESSTNRVSDKINEIKEAVDKKLSVQWYRWTITALVAFVSAVYIISYSGLLSFKDSAEKRIIKLEVEQNQSNSQDCHCDTVKVEKYMKNSPNCP